MLAWINWNVKENFELITFTSLTMCKAYKWPAKPQATSPSICVSIDWMQTLNDYNEAQHEFWDFLATWNEICQNQTLITSKPSQTSWHYNYIFWYQCTKWNPTPVTCLSSNDMCGAIRIHEWSRMFDANRNQFATEL